MLGRPIGTESRPTGVPEASRRGEEPPDQRQTGLCSMQRPVILLSGLPPDLPDGFIRRAYRPSDRPALPTALPEALAGRVTWVILTGWFYTPALPAGFVPAAIPACLTDQPHRPASPASPTDQPDRPATPVARPAASPASHTSQPNRPAQPTSPTDQPDRPARPAASPASPTDQPDRPARPATLTAIHPGKGPAGLPYR